MSQPPYGPGGPGDPGHRDEQAWQQGQYPPQQWEPLAEPGPPRAYGPGYGPQPGYGPPPGWGPQPGYPGPMRSSGSFFDKIGPRTRQRPLPRFTISLAAAGVVLVIAGVTMIPRG